MSQQVFPSLPGLAWSVLRTPVWSTIKHKSVSGRALRVGRFSYPLYKYSMNYEILRADAVYAELQTLVGFFNAMHGAADTFLYSDPADNAVTAQGFGTGDGATVAFQLVRSFGGYAEPIYDFNGAPAISVGGVLKTLGTDYTINLSGGLRTNLLLYSEQFDSIVWGKNTGVTVTANNTAAPDGTLTADRIAYDGTGVSGDWRIYQSETIPPSGIASTVSIYLRADVPTTLSLYGNYATPQNFITCNVTTSWQRFSVNLVTNGVNYNQLTIHSPATNDPFTVYTWGAQLEASSVATGYLKTTAQQVSALDPGTVIFNAPPAASAALTWTGNYYRRCAFQKDELDFENFMKDLWLNKKLEIESVKP